MDELAGVVGLVPPADVPLNLVHIQEGLLDKAWRFLKEECQYDE
eukprot:gene7168-277_t